MVAVNAALRVKVSRGIRRGALRGVSRTRRTVRTHVAAVFF